MQIVHVIDSLKDRSAGPTQSVLSLARQQSSDGHLVSIITLQTATSSVFNYQLIDRYPRLQVVYLWILSWVQYYQNYGDEAQCDEKLIIHLHGIWRPLTNLPLILFWPSSVRMIISPRGMLMQPAMQNKKLKKIISWWTYQKWLLHRVDSFHATGNLELQSCKLYFPKKSCFIVKNGISVPDNNLSNYHINGNKKDVVVGFLGRIHPIKNIELLIKSWSSLSDLSDELKLIICGPNRDDHLPYLKELVKKLKIKNIEFRDEVHGKEKAHFFKEIDCLVLPSKSENFGVVVAEALANAVPVICTNNAPWAVLEERKMGWSIFPEQEKLTKTIRDVHSKKDNLRNMGIQGMIYASECLSWTALAKEMVSYYKQSTNHD